LADFFLFQLRRNIELAPKAPSTKIPTTDDGWGIFCGGVVDGIGTGRSGGAGGVGRITGGTDGITGSPGGKSGISARGGGTFWALAGDAVTTLEDKSRKVINTPRCTLFIRLNSLLITNRHLRKLNFSSDVARVSW